MTTDMRAEPARQREARPASNFHAPSALDSYGRHFSRIGIASVAAAAAQLRRGRAAPAGAGPSPLLFLQDHDAA